ncbi:chemotaxis protein CheW [Aquabacterium sp.]|uniref:chemotaxis protein CheW n=1 Tax=Aquabacterium sp. TaxID=1872578 RepID=UPI002CA5D3F7|nr:chemotaxis protein CheW [Aquabacterium sp.]HSW08807.1 chemotaxis protein CheW [Aquabacterium sp.]
MQRVLICRVQDWRCALPLAQVVETMRVQAIRPLAGAPSFVLGVAVLRGQVVPVVDAAHLLGMPSGRAERLVSIRVDERVMALAVSEVIGVRALDPGSLQALPPLLGDSSADLISAIGRLDAELLLVLRHARLLPEAAWAALDASGVLA